MPEAVPEPGARVGEPTTSFVGIVLTGGRSSRMGTDKALMVLEGRTMVERVCAVLWSAGASSVHAVGGDTPAIRLRGIEAVDDAHPGAGPLGALATVAEGFRVRSEVTVVVVSCDLPAVRSATVRRLVEELAADPEAQAAVPVAGGIRQVHLLATRGGALTALVAAFGEGERSLQRALRRLDVREIHDVDPFELRDLDSPADVADYARRSRDARDDAPA